MKILVVEDNAAQADFVVKGLRESGHCVDLAENGRAGLLLAVSEVYQLIITDRLMPLMDGLQMIQSLRAGGVKTPVLILSALDSVDERVKGLRGGGDDYLVKPFAFSELLARAEILGARPFGINTQQDNSLTLSDLSLDRLSRKARRGANSIELNTREYQLLEYFMLNIGRVLTRTMLLEQVWGHSFDPQTNVIDVHVGRLRKKIDTDKTSRLLHTVRGAGYKLECVES